MPSLQHCDFHIAHVVCADRKWLELRKYEQGQARRNKLDRYLRQDNVVIQFFQPSLSLPRIRHFVLLDHILHAVPQSAVVIRLEATGIVQDVLQRPHRHLVDEAQLCDRPAMVSCDLPHELSTLQLDQQETEMAQGSCSTPKGTEYLCRSKRYKQKALLPV